MENEENAIASYERRERISVERVGFILPSGTDNYGGSPDGLVGGDGLLETKCPKPETVIRYHADGGMPVEHRPQVQGLLLISGRKWCDFYAWHPQLEPYIWREPADLDYQAKLLVALDEFIVIFREISERVSKLERPDPCVMPGELV